MVGSAKRKAKSSGRSSGASRGSRGGRSMDYAIALDIQKKFGGTAARSGSRGGLTTSVQELNLRNRTLRATAASTDRVRKDVAEINAPKRGGMVPAKRRSGRSQATSAKHLDRQQLGLRDKTLKGTPPASTPAKKRVQSVMAPQRGGMVATGGRGGKGKAK